MYFEVKGRLWNSRCQFWLWSSSFAAVVESQVVIRDHLQKVCWAIIKSVSVLISPILQQQQSSLSKLLRVRPDNWDRWGCRTGTDSTWRWSTQSMMTRRSRARSSMPRRKLRAMIMTAQSSKSKIWIHIFWGEFTISCYCHNLIWFCLRQLWDVSSYSPEPTSDKIEMDLLKDSLLGKETWVKSQSWEWGLRTVNSSPSTTITSTIHQIFHQKDCHQLNSTLSHLTHRLIWIW